MAEEARLISPRRTVLAAAAATLVVAIGATAFLDRATRDYVAANAAVDRLATATTPQPWASPRTLRVDPMPVGSITRPGERPRIRNTITDPAAGMPQ